MLLPRLTEKELRFCESFKTPKILAECLFSDFNNFGRFEENKFSELRLYQLPMLSDEPLIDFEATAKYHKLSKRETFELRKNVGDIYNFGGRLFGKTMIIKLDIVLSALYEKGLKSALWSIDEKRIRGVLDGVRDAFEFHPIFKIWDFVVSYKPEISLYGRKNYWSLKGVNITLQGKNPGRAWYQLHVEKAFGEEASFETEQVFKVRRDSGGELGCIERQIGMTNFTRYSPAGKTFYDPKNTKKVLNLPRYVNPHWSKEDLEDALREFGGKEAPNFRIFVGGEIIEDGVSEFDIDRIKDCYMTKKTIKRFELKKEQFKNFKSLVVVERPKNAERIFIAADIGESAGTDISIFSEVGDKYIYLYNIILYNFIEDEQKVFFKWLIEKLEAEIVGFDCGEALGRGLADYFEKLYSKDNVVRYAGASKIEVGVKKDKNGKTLIKKGKPVYRQEYCSEWSVARLKVLLYENRIAIPADFKLQDQLNCVISTHSGTRKMYECISETGDHLFSGWRVFAIMEWLKKSFNNTPRMSTEWCSGVSSWTSNNKQKVNQKIK